MPTQTNLKKTTSAELSGQSEELARAANENEPEESKLCDQSIELGKNVQIKAEQYKAASDAKFRALNSFNEELEREEVLQDQAHKVAKADVKFEEEYKIELLLCQAGKMANQALEQVGMAASYVKESIIYLDAEVDETKDETVQVANEEDDNEQTTSGVFDQVGNATKHVLEEAGKAASDVKMGTVNLVHKATEPAGKSEGATPGPDKFF